MTKIEDLIGAITTDKVSDAKQHFDDIISSKMSDALDAKRIEIASSMYGDSTDEEIQIDSESAPGSQEDSEEREDSEVV